MNKPSATKATWSDDFVIAPVGSRQALAIPYMWLEDYLDEGERWARWGHYVVLAHVYEVIDGHVPMIEAPSQEPTPLVTASQVGRLMACGGGARLPRVRDLREERAADRGTALHSEILDEARCSLKGGFLWAWLHQECGLVGGLSSTERAMIVYSDGDATNYGRLDEHRAYVPEPGRRWAIGGTEDAGAEAFLPPDGALVIRVADLKTGHAQLYGGALETPADAWQLRTLAVLRWHLAGRPRRVRAHLAWACWDEEDQRGWMIEADRPFGVDDLAAWWCELCAFMDGLASQDQEFVRGSHCRYCSSFTFCPAQRTALAAIEAVVPDLATVLPEDLEQLTEQQLGDLYWNLTALEEQAVRARAAFSVLVERRAAVPVGQGREVVIKRNLLRRIVDQEAVDSIARSIGVSNVSKTVTTIESIRAAIAESIEDGSIKVEGKPAAILETFLHELDKLGGIDMQPTEPFIQIRKAVKK